MDRCDVIEIGTGVLGDAAAWNLYAPGAVS